MEKHERRLNIAKSLIDILRYLRKHGIYAVQVGDFDIPSKIQVHEEVFLEIWPDAEKGEDGFYRAEWNGCEVIA